MQNKVKVDQICFWSAFVGFKGGIFGAIYSFLPIYLEVSISFRIFANKKEMIVRPNYNFPEINLQRTPEELDGQNIVALIDETMNRMNRE